MTEKYQFKVFSATDGVNTIYSVTRRMTNAAAEINFSCDFNVIEETLEFSADDITALNKMHVLTVKTGHDASDILAALKRAVNNCEDDSFKNVIMFLSKSQDDRDIINKWMDSK